MPKKDTPKPRYFSAQIEEDNNAEEFWSGEGGKLWSSLFGKSNYGRISGELLIKFKACPGWVTNNEPIHLIKIDR
jgi:hypothetical protein